MPVGSMVPPVPAEAVIVNGPGRVVVVVLVVLVVLVVDEVVVVVGGNVIVVVLVVVVVDVVVVEVVVVVLVVVVVGDRSNVAVQLRSAVMETIPSAQSASPDQPVKSETPSGVGGRVTSVPGI